MRQAGRWDPEFNKVRAGKSFYEFSEDVESAVRASLCPKRFGVDAIILFYDITTLPVAMGLPFELKAGSGPVPDRPIRTAADLDRLNPNPDPASYAPNRAALEAGQGGPAGRATGDRVPGRPFPRRPFLHRQGKGGGRPPPLRRREAGGVEPALGEAVRRDGRVPPHAD